MKDRYRNRRRAARPAPVWTLHGGGFYITGFTTGDVLRLESLTAGSAYVFGGRTVSVVDGVAVLEEDQDAPGMRRKPSRSPR